MLQSKPSPNTLQEKLKKIKDTATALDILEQYKPPTDIAEVKDALKILCEATTCSDQGLRVRALELLAHTGTANRTVIKSLEIALGKRESEVVKVAALETICALISLEQADGSAKNWQKTIANVRREAKNGSGAVRENAGRIIKLIEPDAPDPRNTSLPEGDVDFWIHKIRSADPAHEFSTARIQLMMACQDQDASAINATIHLITKESSTTAIKVAIDFAANCPDIAQQFIPALIGLACTEATIKPHAKQLVKLGVHVADLANLSIENMAVVERNARLQNWQPNFRRGFLEKFLSSVEDTSHYKNVVSAVYQSSEQGKDNRLSPALIGNIRRVLDTN